MIDTTITGQGLGAGVLGRREEFLRPSSDTIQGSRRRGPSSDGSETAGRGTAQTIEAQAVPADAPRGNAPQFPRLSSTFVTQFIAQQISPPATAEQRTRIETAVSAYRQAQSFLDERRGGPLVQPTQTSGPAASEPSGLFNDEDSETGPPS